MAEIGISLRGSKVIFPYTSEEDLISGNELLLISKSSKICYSYSVVFKFIKKVLEALVTSVICNPLVKF